MLGVLLLMLTGCASRSPNIPHTEPVPPIPGDNWREIQEEIWTASTLAYFEAEYYARGAMQEWMVRVREKTDTEFVPWYTSYWAQQWIGFKAAWYEMNNEEGDPPVQDYLVDYIQKRYYELVLEPAGAPSDPQGITEQTTALYVQLLSRQLQYIPKVYAVSPQSLKQKLEQIPLITLSGDKLNNISLSFLLERNNLAGVAAYEALLAHADSKATNKRLSPGKEPLQVVVEDTVARLVADLPVRAGGSAVALLVGESLGLFISAGVTAWSINSHDQKKPGIELQLRQALNAGLDDMWERLMKNPRLGVMFAVNHMSQQIETGLFPLREPDALLPF
jgi:hypothetical protein